MTAAPHKLRVAFATLGCKVNQYDTATIRPRCAATKWCRSSPAPTFMSSTPAQ
jgi:tRNA A37 methylthiotransferase MiaB